MQKAVIHTATRVIRRLTTEENHQIQPDETLVALQTPITLNGYAKLAVDNATITTPTQQEIDDSGVDESRVYTLRKQKIELLQSIITDIADNGASLAKLRTYFQTLKGL